MLERIGAAHGRTASQVSLRWLTQQGIIVIPGSGKPDRQKENFEVLDFDLTPSEMAEIDTLEASDGVGCDHLIGVADMRRSVGIGDRRRDVELWLCHKSRVSPAVDPARAS